MRVLGVGGTSSGVGKTAVVCLLLEALPGWGTLKTSVYRGNDPTRDEPLPEGFEIIHDPAVLDRYGTDTARYGGAGSARVRWLRSERDGLAEGIEQALALFTDLPGVIVEGNSFAVHRRPDAFVVVVRPGLDEIKESAWEIRADWWVVNGRGPGPVHEPAFVIDAEPKLWSAGSGRHIRTFGELPT